MTHFELTPEKVAKIISDCECIRDKKTIKIRDLAELVGQLVASEPGVPLAPLFYKELEIDKTEALNAAKGNFESSMSLTPRAL